VLVPSYSFSDGVTRGSGWLSPECPFPSLLSVRLIFERFPCLSSDWRFPQPWATNYR
jgi:hypothetical protein